jgi:IS30 family transposase
MGQEQRTANTGVTGSHFTSEQRMVLEWLWNGKGGSRKERSPTKLAAILGKSRRTIYRELERGMTSHLTSELETVPYYSGEVAQSKADEAKQEHGPGEKIGGDHLLADRIAAKIKDERHSPYAVTAAFEREGWPTEQRLCAKTIYRYLAKGMLYAVTEADLPRGGKRRRKRGGKPPSYHRLGALERSIDRRPAAANDRTESGHWEMDTIKGAQNGHTPCLLTLTERKTRAEIIRKLPDGAAFSVVAALDALERELGTRFPLLFKTITADNGVEFSDYAGLERSCLLEGKRFQLYFAHPYRAHERGSNEHGNGIIRRFFPKGTDFSLVTEEQAAGVQAWMNRYPRKILNGLSPEQVLPFQLLA